MSALTGTLITAIYLSLLFPEFLALTLLGDLSLFLCLRLVNTLLQCLCRYLRLCVGAHPKKRASFTHLLLRLLLVDVGVYSLSTLLLLGLSSKLTSLVLVPPTLTILSGWQAWRERTITL